jgi:predicted porin
VLFTLVATAASGQEPSQRLTITPSLSIGERYDDNIFETQTNKQHDFVTVLSPGIHVRYLSPIPTLGTPFLLPSFDAGRRAPYLPLEPTQEPPFDFDYQANIQFFHDNSDQNNVAHRLGLTVAWPFAPSLQVRLRELLLETDDPLGRDERLSDPTGLRPVSQQQRARTLHNEVEGRADVRLGGRLSLGVLFGSLIEDVDVPQELDEFRYTVGTELGYAINVARESRVFLAYQVTFDSFRDNGGGVPFGGTDASFQAHAISTGIRHELTPTLALQAALGYSFTTSDAPENDDHKAVIANLGLIKTFHLGQASLRYVRRFISGEGQGGVVLADTLGATAAINLTGKLTARLDGNVSWLDFRSVTVSTLNQNQRFWSVEPGLTYQITRPWRAALAYTFEYTDYSDNTTPNLTDHRLFLGTQYALREWLVLELSYRYGARRTAGGNSTVTGVNEFTGNQVMLTVTARPSLRF